MDSMRRLSSVALKTHGDDAVKYIEMQIVHEEKEMSKGWKERVNSLKEQRRHEQLLATVWKQFKDNEGAESEIS